MAIVNEDNGTTYRGKKYHLAKDYLNGLKLPKKVSMDVVPRGVAESGLKDNSYQLAVFIPTDFSAKIVDVDNPNPQKLDIQYKINAKSQAMKSRCHDEAKDIIQGLNKKLVSIYDLGIMSNLFDAQNKVAGIYARQGALAATYRNGLAEPISTLSQGFPDLQDGTKSILSESKAYQQAQKQASQAANLAAAAQDKSEKENLTKIMQQQAKNNQNKAELAKSMMQTSESTDDQIPQEIDALNNQNKQLNQGIGDSKDDAANQLQKDFESYSKGYEEEINTIKKVLQSTNGQLNPDEVKNDIDHQKSPGASIINPNSPNQGSQSDKNSMTLGEYLENNDNEYYKKIYNELMNLDNINDLNALYKELPFNGKIPAEVKATLTNDEYTKLTNDIEDIKKSNVQLANEGFKPDLPGDQNQIKDFIAIYDKVHKNQKDDVVKTQTQKIVLSNFKNVDQDKFRVTVPNKVTITNPNARQVGTNTYEIFVGKSPKLTLDLSFKPVDLKGEDSTVTVEYDHSEDQPKKVTVTNQTNQQITEVIQTNKGNDQQANNHQDQNSQTSQSSQNDSTNNQSADTENAKKDSQTKTTTQIQEVSNDKDRSFTVTFSLAGVVDKQLTSNSQLDRTVGKWLAEYDDAAKMAKARAESLKDRPIQKLMNEKLSDVLSGLVKQANDQNKQNNANLLATIEQNSQKLAQEKANYEKELASIGSSSKQALQDAQSQIQKLQQAQDKLNQAAQKMGTDNSSDMNDLSDLSDQASDTNQDVSQDSGAFDGIYQELTSLNNSLGSIQNSGKSLNGKSMNLQKAFRNELAKSGDFAQSFINVLNAAYRNGVPNQKLLNFITNPVGGTGNEVVSERTQSYNMGMWTIVLVILAWFIAYAIDNMKYFQSGKYFSKKQTKLNVHTRKLIFLGITSLLSGVVLAPIAAKQFPIIDSNRLLWYLSFIFLGMTLTLVFYALMHNARIWGTGLIIAALLNYVFNQTQFLKNVILQHLNVFGLVGNQLLNVAMFNTTNAVLGLVVMGVLMIASGLIILFVPEREQEVPHEEAMV